MNVSSELKNEQKHDTKSGRQEIKPEKNNVSVMSGWAAERLTNWGDDVMWRQNWEPLWTVNNGTTADTITTVEEVLLGYQGIFDS